MSMTINDGKDVVQTAYVALAVRGRGGSMVPVPRGITVADGAHLDAFSRLRVSTPTAQFNHINSYGLDNDIFETIASGAGATVTYLPNENSSELAVGTVSGEYCIRQTFRYFPYTPGKSQLIMQTAVLGAGVTNVTRRVGYFDNSNGFFFELAGSVLSVVKRSFVTGSVVDTTIVQSAWNIDRMDGTGPSGISLDTSKSQIIIIDFQWLGVGRIRYGLDINGIVVYVHEILNANSLTSVYCTTPTLPLRFEIRNTGTSAGATMKQICSCVSSEAGLIPEGEQFSKSHGITTVAVTTRRPVFAIRMAATINGKVNRKTAKLIHTHVRATTNDAFIEIIHGHLPTAITATWTSAGSDSGVEYSTDISVATFTEGHSMSTFFSISGQAQGAAEVLETADILNEHDRICLDYAGTTSSYIVVYATSFSGTSNLGVSQGWIEY
jgi:hypothetical protein